MKSEDIFTCRDIVLLLSERVVDVDDYDDGVERIMCILSRTLAALLVNMAGTYDIAKAAQIFNKNLCRHMSVNANIN